MFNRTVDIKTYAYMSVAIILVGALTFGVICRISKWVNSDNKLVGDVFGKTVVLAVDDLQNTNIKKGNYVVIEEATIGSLAEGDYVVYNNLYSKALRSDNCGQIQSISGDYLYIKNVSNSEVSSIDAGLCLGKLQFREQLDCGWLRFVSSPWCDVVFILFSLIAIGGVSYYIYKRNQINKL